MKRLALFLVVCLSWPASPTQAQVPLEPVPPRANSGLLPFGGSEYFRFFLHLKGLKPLPDFSSAQADPRSTVIICLGDPSWITNDFNAQGGVWRYFQQGGALLIATNNRCDDNRAASWEQTFGVQITGRTLTGLPDDCFEGDMDRPFVKPRGRLPFFNKDTPFEMFSGISPRGKQAIATRRPSTVRLPSKPRPGFLVNSLAGYHESARGADDVRVRSGDDHFAVAFRQDGEAGRLLVVGDDGVFLNGMMRFEPDPVTNELRELNANKRFTDQMIDWLKGPDQSRTNCLFVHNNQVISQFAREIQAPPPEIPPIPPDILANLIFKMANPMLEEVQNRARPNNALNRWPGAERLQKWFIGIATVFFLWVIWTLVGRATRKEDKQRWLSLASLGGLLAKGSSAKRKRRDLIETGNVYDAARWRVRDRFDRLGGQPDDEGNMPPVLMAQNSKQSAGLEKSIHRLWKIGYGEKPVPVPIAVWDELNLDLEKAVRLAGKGLWCFAAHIPAK